VDTKEICRKDAIDTKEITWYGVAVRMPWMLKKYAVRIPMLKKLRRRYQAIRR
jgi:hypothetical protein